MSLTNEVLPGVSVILPILNEERDLAQSIGAILKQDYPSEFEVILALGPSKDRTTQIAEELAIVAQKYPGNVKLKLRFIDREEGMVVSETSSLFKIELTNDLFRDLERLNVEYNLN